MSSAVPPVHTAVPAQHGRSSNVDVLYARVESAALSHGGLERVQVQHHKIYRLRHRKGYTSRQVECGGGTILQADFAGKRQQYS